MSKYFLIIFLVFFFLKIIFASCPDFDFEKILAFEKALKEAELSKEKDRKVFSFAKRIWFIELGFWQKLTGKNSNRFDEVFIDEIKFSKTKVHEKKVQCFYDVTVSKLFNRLSQEEKFCFRMTYKK